MHAVPFAGAGCWRSPTQPKLVKKIAVYPNEEILDKDWLRSRGCALGCDSVCATGDFAFEHARTAKPKFADACNPDIANTCSPEVGNSSSPDIAHARGCASHKST